MADNNQQQKMIHDSKKRFNKKKWLIIAIVFVFFMAGVAGGWLYVGYNKKIQEDKIAAQESKHIKISKEAEDDAQTIIESGGSVSSASVAYDSAIKEAKGDANLTNILLLNKATLYFNNKSYDEALKTALQAEAIIKDDNIEQFIAQIYEIKGNKQSAIKYYNQAITVVDKSRPMANTDIKYYQSKISELGGVVN